MKKGLLLSVAASAIIFAGGDIAPVEPAAPASADFWGQIGVRYQWHDTDWGGKPNKTDYNFGDKENNTFDAAIVLGVEKQLGYGFGFGAEVAGWSDFGFDIADKPSVDTELSGMDQTDAEVSQAYLTYSFGNTAIKAGRQALPKAVSPWAWSDRSVGVLDIAYDAVVIANTDLPDTTVVGAWVANAANGNSPVHLGDNNQGIFMLAAINKSLANTTLSVAGYVAPNYNLTDYGYIKKEDNVSVTADTVWSIWASAETKLDNINAGLQIAYVDGNVQGYETDDPTEKEDLDATFAVAAKIGSSWGDLSASLVAAYINDGQYSLKTAGTGAGTSAFWGNSLGGFGPGGDIILDKEYNGMKQYIVRALASYKVGPGKLYGELLYDDIDRTDDYDYDSAYGARLGYKFKLMNTVDTNIEYRYVNYNYDGNVAGRDDLTKQRIRVEAYYKF